MGTLTKERKKKRTKISSIKEEGRGGVEDGRGRVAEEVEEQER